MLLPLSLIKKLRNSKIKFNLISIDVALVEKVNNHGPKMIL